MSKYALTKNIKPPEDDWSSSDDDDDNRTKDAQRVIKRDVLEKMDGMSLGQYSQQVASGHDKYVQRRTVTVDQKMSHTVMEVEKTEAHESTRVNRTGDSGVNWDGGVVDRGAVGVHDSQKPVKAQKVDMKGIRSRFNQPSQSGGNTGGKKPQIQDGFGMSEEFKIFLPPFGSTLRAGIFFNQKYP